MITDRWRGLNFAHVIETEELGFNPDIVYRSEPSGGTELVDFFKDLNIKPNDAIIDIGCGKGSAMRSMLKFPFCKVAGIEISDKIFAIAMNNFKILKDERCHLFNVNAAQFEDYSDYNIFYLFNPFPDIILERVIKMIDDSANDREHESIVVYVNPEFHDTLIKHSHFKLKKKTKVRWHETNIYSNRTESSSRFFHDE